MRNRKTQRSQRSNRKRSQRSMRSMKSQRANNIYAFRPTSQYIETPWPSASGSAINMVRNESMIDSLPNNAPATLPMTPSAKSIGSLNSKNYNSTLPLSNNSIQNVSGSSMTLTGVLGGKYRIEGEVTLIPLEEE